MPGDVEEHASNDKARSRRFRLKAGLIAAAITFYFIVLPCAFYEAGSRAITGREIALARQLYIAIYRYHNDRGAYPPSLDTAEFQPYIDKEVADFLKGGHVIYYRPEQDSPRYFRVLKVRLLRGELFFQLDGGIK